MKFHLPFYYWLTTNPFSAVQSAFIFATLNILVSSANFPISLLSPASPCCLWTNWTQQFLAQNPVEFHRSSSTIAVTANLLCFPSSNRLSVPGHAALQHGCLVSLGFWWVTLSKVSWKATWVISDGLSLWMFVDPFKELKNWVSQNVGVLKLIVFIWLSTNFSVFFTVSSNLSATDTRLESHLDPFHICYPSSL